MSLVSGAFLTTLAIVAVGAVVAAMLLWRRLAAAGWQWVVARLGVVLGIQLCGVALVAGMTNAYFDFYPTLPALFGATGTTALQTGGRPTNGWISSSAPDAALMAVHQPVHTTWGDLWRDPSSASWRAGTTLVGDLTGSTTHLSNSRLRVWLPAQYQQPAYRHYAFPVVMSLSGFPGNPLAWWKIGLPRTAQAAFDSHRMAPFIFVALTPDTSPTRDTECTNVPSGPQAETFLAADVPQDVTHLFRAAAPGASWAVTGDSTGGYCSVKLALDHPDVFRTAVSFGGYFKAITDVTTGNLDGGSAAHRDGRNLIWVATHRPPPRVSILLTAATGDRTTVPDAEAFASAAQPPTIVSRLITQGGGHNWPTWEAQLGPMLTWLGRHLEAPPSGTSL